MSGLSADMKALTIGVLAKQAGVSMEAIRFYERRGLVPDPRRSASGYRVYPSEAAKRLRFIKRAQELGFTLKEVKELLSIRASEKSGCGDILKKTSAKVKDIEGKIRTLEAMKRSLTKLNDRCPGCGPASECPILDSFEDEIA